MKDQKEKFESISSYRNILTFQFQKYTIQNTMNIQVVIY